MKVSIVIPVFNEEKTAKSVIDAVRLASFGVDVEREIIVVDDGSQDNTPTILKKITDIKLIGLEKNQGKGAAVKCGLRAATGDFVLIQDADLEYDVKDYPKLLKPLLEGVADVVFGNRFYGEKHTVIYFRNYVGNKFLTFLSNLLTGLDLGDMEVGYKVFRKEVVDSFKEKLISKRFGIEPELVARVAHGKPALPNGSRGRWRIAEVPVNYYSRTYKEGKKIGAWDGVKAIFAIIYFNVLRK